MAISLRCHCFAYTGGNRQSVGIADLQGTSADPRMCRIYPGDAPPIPFSDATASSGKLSSAAARFSRRCATDEVPGIRRMLGAR